LLSGIAAAAPVTVDGVTFSDELGGVEIERATGHGSIDDPFVIVERLTGPEGATLVIRVPATFGNRIGSVQTIGFALVKVVENATDFAWTAFDLELESKRGVPSDYLDGLSFGQGSTSGRPFTATGFDQISIVDEPFDQVELSKGRVAIGEQMIVRFVVSESMPLGEAYLLQRPIRPIARRLGTQGTATCAKRPEADSPLAVAWASTNRRCSPETTPPTAPTPGAALP
jgi:hypothetical protein